MINKSVMIIKFIEAVKIMTFYKTLRIVIILVDL